MKMKINFMSVAGGVAGGAIAKFVSKFTDSEDKKDGEVDFMTVAVQAVGGAVISAFSKNDLLKGIGNGMIGVAGYKLATDLKLGEDTTTPATSGLLASQNAVGALLPSQNAVGRLLHRRPIVRGVEEEEAQKATANVQ